MDVSNQDEQLKEQLKKIKNTIVVLAGKGGVGKSTVAVNTAMNLSLKGFKVGLLDVDVHGPSIPTLLGLEGKKLESNGQLLLPIEYSENLKVVSTGFMIDNPTNPIIWRGPMKMGFIKQMISEVLWEELDYLINVARLWLNQPCILPCTPKGILVLLDKAGVEIAGKKAVVVGRSNIVGKPVAKLLLDRNATVTIAHSRTKDLPAVCREADILVAAVGRPLMLTADYVKEGAAVIDVGINRVDGHLVGDVD